MIKHIFTTFITAIITVFFTYYFANSFLEYREFSKEQYYNTSSKLFDALDIRFKDKKIDNISIYEFAIHNNTLEDLENVNIYFTLKAKEGKEIPNIINKGLFPPSKLPNNKITELEQKDKNLYAYNIALLKQTPINEYYLARFIFEGKEVPQIIISTPETKNVDIIKYRYLKEYTIIGITILTVLFVIIIFISLIDGWSNNRYWNKKRVPKLKELLKKLNLNDNMIDLISNNYEKEFKEKNNFIYKKLIDLLKK